MESVEVAAAPPRARASARRGPGPSAVIQDDIRRLAGELEPVLRPLRGTTLLVTGGMGFLCSYFVETAAYLNAEAWEKPCRVLCVDNLITGRRHRLAHLAKRREIRFIQHDVAAPPRLRERVSWIIHGAGIASPTTYRRYPLETIAVNVDGTRRMLELAKAQRARSLLYVSTSEIYGDPPADQIPTTETYWGHVSCTGPRACYDESKRLAETLCMIYARQHRVPVKVVRPFNVYGPGQRLDDRRIIPDLMSAALARRTLTVHSDGRATRSFCYIRDAVSAMWRVLLSGRNGEAFNIGNDQEEITIQGLTERMRQAAAPWLAVEHRPSRDPEYLTNNPQRRRPDLTKLRTAFGWAPQVALAEGLRRTLDSYRNGSGA